jgi:hypothetical protein
MAKTKPTKIDAISIKALRDLDEYENSLSSITNSLGKQSDAYNLINKNLKKTNEFVRSTADLIEHSTKLTDSNKKAILKAAEAYKDTKKTIADSVVGLSKGEKTQSEYNKAIIDSYKNYQKLVDSIDTSTKAGRETAKAFQIATTEMESFANAAKRSEKILEGVNTTLDQIGGSGVQGMRELTDVMKTATNGGKGLTTALFALGAALGALAYNYGLVGDKVGLVAGFDKDLIETQKNIDLIDNKIKGAFAGETAAGNFVFQVQQMVASFQAASKTALFGKGVGSVGYGAGQLELAGISAQTIADGMKAAANETGRMPTGKIGADMAIMAARTGQSAEGIASINDSFMRMDGVSEKTALNLQEGVRAMADKAGVNLGGVMEEMAGASKEMLGYQIKSGSALARQVVFAKSMGVSFNEIAKAGQSMVLNYKDSIKAEMSLSAMLGKNVDLSEVRAKFASGDTEGAMKALKAQGLNPAEMDMFQQQQLQSALGGMDLTSAQKIATRTGRGGGELKAGAVGAGNQQFLSATEQAQRELAIQTANISVTQASFNIKQDAKAAAAVQQAIIDNLPASIDGKPVLGKDGKPIGRGGLEVEKVQTEGLKGLFTGLETMLFGLGAAAIGSLLPAGAKKLMGKGAPTVPTSTSPTGKLRGPNGQYLPNKLPPASVADDVAKAGSKGAGMMGKVGKFAKFGGKLLGKVAAPLAIGMAIYDGFQGFNADKSAATGDKILNAGSSILSGLSFGLLGKDSDTIKAEADARATTPGNKSVATTISNSEKFLQDKLTYMSGNLERVVDRTNRTMINTAATTKELTTLNTNTKAIMNLTKTIEALTVATYQGSRDVSVKIDGKKVAYSYNKYTENTKSTGPGISTTKK